MTRKRTPNTRRPTAPTVYSMMDVLLASDTLPMSPQKRRHQISRMAGGLDEMMHAPDPSNDAWRVLSDAVNLLETLVQCGEAPVKTPAGKTIASHWRDCDGQPTEVRDSTGLLDDAIAAMAKAGARAFDGHPLRLDGPGIAAVRAVLEDYQTALEHLPARTMIRCHRATEKRIRKVFGHIANLPDGVHVVAV